MCVCNQGGIQMKIYISADIEGVNGIHHWDETNSNNPKYQEFKKQMAKEVEMACIGAHEAGAKEIYVKDAHDSAMNLSLQDLPDYVTLHRGWEGNLCSMMAGLDETFDAVIFIGYHSPSRSDGNTLSHTMSSSSIVHIKINGRIISEFDINAMYATTKGVPIAFLSGDFNLTKLVKATNPHITTVATKIGQYGATVSLHPNVTNEQIKTKVKHSLSKELHKNLVALPESFDVEIQYRNCARAHFASFYPGCSQIKPDRIAFSSTNYIEVLRMFHFNL